MYISTVFQTVRIVSMQTPCSGTLRNQRKVFLKYIYIYIYKKSIILREFIVGLLQLNCNFKQLKSMHEIKYSCMLCTHKRAKIKNSWWQDSQQRLKFKKVQNTLQTGSQDEKWRRRRVFQAARLKLQRPQRAWYFLRRCTVLKVWETLLYFIYWPCMKCPKELED